MSSYDLTWTKQGERKRLTQNNMVKQGVPKSLFRDFSSHKIKPHRRPCTHQNHRYHDCSRAARLSQAQEADTTHYTVECK